MSREIMRKYIDIINEANHNLDEAWDSETKVSPREQGKYEGKTIEELRRSYNALKASGPHHRGSPEFGRMPRWLRLGLETTYS